MKFKVFWKEKVYFIMALLTSIAVYLGLFYVIKSFIERTEFLSSLIVFIIYFLFILLYFLLSHLILIGHLQGNAVKVTKNQLSDIYRIYVKQCEKMNIARIPTFYLMQSGGMLNAFATRFFGRNYVVIYSDIMEKAYEDGLDIVEFILAHELTHIKRNHLLKRLLVLPSSAVFFIYNAYTRACEVTCDSFASVLSPNGSIKGLMLLAAGKQLYDKIDIQEYINSAVEEKTFAKKIATITSSHPHLSDRVRILLKNKEIVKTI